MRRIRLRAAIGGVGFVGTAVAARQRAAGPLEARAFRLVNDLPDGLYPPVWVLMQLGNVSAAPVAAAVARLAGDRRLSRHLALAGGTGWALSKLIKRGIERPRPAALVAGARIRGREQAGLGYLSGHAAVAVALGVAARPHVGPGARRAIAAAMPLVGLCRIYVGAHMPLDVIGGASLGLLVEASLAGGRAPADAAHRPDVSPRVDAHARARSRSPSRSGPAMPPT